MPTYKYGQGFVDALDLFAGDIISSEEAQSFTSFEDVEAALSQKEETRDFLLPILWALVEMVDNKGEKDLLVYVPGFRPAHRPENPWMGNDFG